MVEPIDDGAEVVLRAEASLDSQIVTATGHNRAPLTPGEQAVIAHMVDMGKTCAEIARSLGRHVQTVSKYVKKQQQRLEVEGGIDEYIQLHRVGARIAASRGNTRPAEFILERFEVVPRLRDIAAQEPNRIAIAVGLNLPGSVQTVPKAELAVLDVPSSTSNDKG